LMGDAGWDVENYIINSCNNLGITKLLLTRDFYSVLKMGHHGSAYSTSPAWITAIQPDAVFVSSDTMKFGGTGMPSDTLIAAIKSGTNLGSTCFAHQYVQFNTTTKNFEKVPSGSTTTDNFCSALYDFTLNAKTGEYAEEGGTWQ